MLYPIAILKGNENTAHSIFFPDIENLVSACDDLDEIYSCAIECIDLHFSGLVEDGESIPLPQGLDQHVHNPAYQSMMWAWVDIDIAKYDTKSHKVTVTLPNYLIHEIDKKVLAHKSLYKSRSNYLAQLALRDLSVA